jgi:dephospho-CoA kinase
VKTGNVKDAKTFDRPVVIGLTGAIGTGKSGVLQTLVSLGADGIDADQVAHQVMEPGEPAYALVMAAFGPEILGPDGRIDRRRLGARVFGEEGALARLEGIVHPAVEEVLRVRVGASTAPAVVIEAIKLLEAGLSRALCDHVWVTTCARRQQFARLAVSRGMQPEQVQRRLAVQMPVREMIVHADRLVDTGGTISETGLSVLGAWIELGLPLPEPRVRPGTHADAEGIAAVLNAVVREGGLTVIDRTFAPARERAFLRGLPRRARLAVAEVGKVIAGFQVIEPYALFTAAMDHAATLGTYVAAPVRGIGLGQRMSEETFEYARSAGYGKIVVQVRADNPGAQGFYAALGFQACGRLARQARIAGRYVDVLLLEKFLE